jgi:hypothetical protein
MAIVEMMKTREKWLIKGRSENEVQKYHQKKRSTQNN